MPFMITEMGSFAYGRMFWGERDMEGPASHTCAISDADFIVRALAHGTQTFLRWAFSVPAHYDGRWSLVEWDTEGVRPTPNIYPLYRELMRAIRPGCRVMKVNIGQAAGMPRPVSAVATSCGSEINLIIINAQPGMNHDIIIGDGPWRGRKMRRVAVDETRKGVELVPVDFPDTPDFGAELVLSPYSLTVLRSET
jgi:hypothetical protein